MSKYIPRLLDDYNKKIKPALSKDLNISNDMRIPKILKISLNIGFGQARLNENQLKAAIEELTNISGQKAVVTKSKKAISNFKIRENDPVGIKVTLRATKMYEFLDRFISVASPRIRDFRGLSSKGFDGFGNYNFGITEQIIFPEINYDKVKRVSGMNINIVTSAQSSHEAYKLLMAFGLPLRENKKLENSTEK
jgi:large subunit ribosomal protein L5|tara:strand:- start:165 stop:746 length:582 start_codon:yes stop_codon:yes gene_type:complete